VILGALPARGNLNSISDVNNAKVNGIWTVVDVSGMPGSNYGNLVFVASTGNYKGQQIYFPTGGVAIAQRRLYSSGEWSEWLK